MPEIQISKEKAAALYRTMKLIRCFEESVKRDYLNKELPGFVHLYIGEEAIAAGVCAALRQDDLIESTHRGHGHCIAKGADIDRMMAEIYGKETGFATAEAAPCTLRIFPSECWVPTAL